jgi:hypothetical protein
MRNRALLFILVSVSLWEPARAGEFLRYYLFQRTEPEAKQAEQGLSPPSPTGTSKELTKEPTTPPQVSEEAPKAAQITQSLWFGPAASLDFFVWEARTHAYKLGLSPGIGYGLHWSPSWWRATQAFVALDLFVQMQAVTVGDGSLSYFNIDFVPTVSFFDWFGIGVGPRVSLPLKDNLQTTSTALLSVGIRKSI